MIDPKNIQIEQYDYELPEARIARYPAAKRDDSKLLVYRNGNISQTIFNQIGDYLTEHCLVISNNTRVIPARLFFKKQTGGMIEVFCLEPENTSHQDAMNQRGKSNWWCMVGGAKKWKGDESLIIEEDSGARKFSFHAKKLKQDQEKFLIEFSWPVAFTFSEMLEMAGELPLPPYFNRGTEESDYERYQTIFAQNKGSVAAPTAGLHFTPELIRTLKQNKVSFEEITLHVGAGTFRPVSSEKMDGHNMHSESFSIEGALLERILSAPDKKIVAIGTTTMRTLESLYWLGVKILQGSITNQTLNVQQWDAYELSEKYTTEEALNALLGYLEQEGRSSLNATTSILIAPGYSFKICKGLVTNFHLPKSTLLLLIAAFTEQNNDSENSEWKRIYDYALNHEFRFLSYGDSSLLLA